MIEATDSIAVAYISPFEVLAQDRSVWSPAKVQGQRTQGRYMFSCAEQIAERRLDDRTCLAPAWHAAGRAARGTLADVCAGALASTRRCRFLHNGGVDHARTRDVLHRIRDRIAVPACTNPGLDAVSGRSLRHPVSAVCHERVGRSLTKREDLGLRSRSEVE